MHFITNMKAINAEKAVMQQKIIQFKVERMAKLPFQSNADPTHLEQLKEEFTLQATIDLVEDYSCIGPERKMRLHFVILNARTIRTG